jgi:hypothetical protein
MHKGTDYQFSFLLEAQDYEKRNENLKIIHCFCQILRL